MTKLFYMFEDGDTARLRTAKELFLASSFSFEASIRKRMGIMVITINLVGLFFFYIYF